ncbi:MAG: heavy metal translocating P-type ATPase metal-binding domain-containing protein [Alphaproteobacteria bacterium]|nr:heavy metal translocating P-type ATPase metal-binding domain-containing protein [Alphaproteobacteria bacterium]
MGNPDTDRASLGRLPYGAQDTHAVAACRHCGSQLDGGAGEFCCPGCAAAWQTVQGFGLESYYRRRVLDPAMRATRPDAESPRFDLAPYVTARPDGRAALTLAVDGLHCAACVWLIESVLARAPGIESARVNMTTRRLRLVWRPGEADPEAAVRRVAALGYRLIPFDEAGADDAGAARQRALLRAMAVAGFAAANVMLLSVSVWAGHVQDMGPATRDLMHWISALIALPAIGYAGRPFFRPALAALAARRVNMDVPISLAVLLAAGMSLVQTATSQPHAYFDSAVTLLFFLLIGRYLDARSRGRARAVAANLLALRARAVTLVDGDGATRVVAPAEIRAGMTVLVAVGERVPVDGRIAAGTSDLDTAPITGESVPRPARPGDTVLAGTVNLTGPLRVTVESVGEDTVLAEILRLVETAEQGRARHVALSDRVARYYAPAVHSLALATFLGWWLVLGAGLQAALLNAIAVLIITCPCALALAVPAVQVAAAGRLLRGGVLIKSATALERLATVDTVVFDKTGTLTQGRPTLLRDGGWTGDDLAAAAAIAAASRHPLARALAAAVPDAKAADDVAEVPGSGLRRGAVLLGSREWCGVDAGAESEGPELWLARPGAAALRFAFRDTPRPDAEAVVGDLLRSGYRVELLSGDRPLAAGALAGRLGIARWRGGCTPAGKAAHLAALAAAGHRVCMVGDGLNDAPALGHAQASMSPADATDIAQNAADVVFQGERLAPVAEALAVARRSNRLVLQNLALAFAYNATTIPLAMIGLVTPLIAAIAMSASSLAVVGNALRIGRGTRR